jgi:hypothetical protein
MNEKVTPAQRLMAGEVNLVISPSNESFKTLNPQERKFAEALISITQEYGKFDEDGEGVWAGYSPPSKNDVKDIGVKCANCVMWEGGTTCKIIALPVEAEAKCRLAVIPDGVVQKSK